ncbi:hypothetical protein Hte_007985 [Hypoxylon texense]
MGHYGFPSEFFPSRPQHPPANGGGFAPMNTWYFSALDASPEWSEQLKATGASPFYRCNPLLEANQSAVTSKWTTKQTLPALPPTPAKQLLWLRVRNSERYGI